MAELKTGDSQNQNKNREVSTNPEDMLADAKEYAKRDMSTIMTVLNKLNIVEANPEHSGHDEFCGAVVKAVVATKYEQIEKARVKTEPWRKYLD